MTAHCSSRLRRWGRLPVEARSDAMSRRTAGITQSSIDPVEIQMNRGLVLGGVSASGPDVAQRLSSNRTTEDRLHSSAGKGEGQLGNTRCCNVLAAFCVPSAGGCVPWGVGARGAESFEDWFGEYLWPYRSMVMPLRALRSRWEIVAGGTSHFGCGVRG